MRGQSSSHVAAPLPVGGIAVLEWHYHPVMYSKCRDMRDMYYFQEKKLVNMHWHYNNPSGKGKLRSGMGRLAEIWEAGKEELAVLSS